MSTLSLYTWLMSHERLYEYKKSISYKKEDMVTIGNMVYQSIDNNNLGNDPQTSNKWIKII